MKRIDGLGKVLGWSVHQSLVFAQGLCKRTAMQNKIIGKIGRYINQQNGERKELTEAQN